MPNATLVSSPEAVRAPISAPWPRIKWETPEEESVPAGWRATGAVWCDEVGVWGNTLETTELAWRLTYAGYFEADFNGWSATEASNLLLQPDLNIYHRTIDII